MEESLRVPREYLKIDVNPNSTVCAVRMVGLDTANHVH